uniref:Uncharacterized protein n=1 Tax=Panagrolaimus sp. PS1159 TaxID=55785 RepID=A0AC35G769_9BILA
MVVPSFNDKIWFGDIISTNLDVLLFWMPNIQRCTVKEITIRRGNLLWNDFKVLTKERTIEILDLQKDVKVIDSDGKMISLEDIFAYVPNISFFHSNCFTHVTPNTMKELCNRHNGTKKLTNFQIENLDGLLYVEDFLEFMKKYGTSNSTFIISFSDAHVPKKEATEFLIKIKLEIEKWPKSKRPIFNPR